MNEQLRKKEERCDSYSKRIAELETQTSVVNDFQAKLAEKVMVKYLLFSSEFFIFTSFYKQENAIMEKENQTKSIQETLTKKEALIQRMKQDHDRILVEKNLDINRLESGKCPFWFPRFQILHFFYFSRNESNPERSRQLQNAAGAQHQN